MKIAAVTNDGRSISAHFGRALHYLVLTVEDGVITGREMRDKSTCNHGHHGHDHHHHEDNQQLADDSTGQAIALSLTAVAPPVDDHGHAAAVIADCEVVLSRGMGGGMYRNLQHVGVRPVLTDMVLIEEAVRAYLAGQLQEQPHLVH